jgi:hypothetical protein
MKDDQLAHYARFLKALPEGPKLAGYHQYEIREALGSATEEVEQQITSERRSALEAIQNLIPPK